MKLLLVVLGAGLIIAVFRLAAASPQRIVAVTTAACIALMIPVGTDLLTPLFFYGDGQGRPAVKPILLIAEFAVLILVLRESRKLGMTLAWALSLIIIILMPFNFLGTLLGAGWGGTSVFPGYLFCSYYLLQFPILISSVRDLKRSGEM